MTGAILLERFRAHHLESLRGEPSVAPLLPYLTSEGLRVIEQAPHAYSILKNGRPLVCGGVSEYWPNRGEAWAVFSEEAKNYPVTVTRMILRFLKVCPIRRIEAAVEVDFKRGHDLVRVLGFTQEAPRVRAYMPSGGDCSLYALVGG